MIFQPSSVIPKGKESDQTHLVTKKVDFNTLLRWAKVRWWVAVGTNLKNICML